MKLKVFLPVLLISLSACAKPPGSIAPAYVSDAGYKSMSCKQLSAELTRVNAQLPPLEQQQQNASTGDAVGVFLIGVPVSSLGGGDVEGQIARLRGERQAIEGTIVAKEC